MTTTPYTPYFGSYIHMGIQLDVALRDTQLVATMPGIPPGYEIVLTATDTPHQFSMSNGPFRGAPVQFQLNTDGLAETAVCGPFELQRHDGTSPLPTTTDQLFLPPMTLTPEKEAAFAHLLDTILAQADSNWIDYDLPYPKQEFVRYVTAQDVIIFHGSNNRDITEFVPIRQSYELQDTTGRGNMQAIYGTHDGIWSMFFAIVARKKLKGSIRNGVMHFHNTADEELAVYNFSVNETVLPQQPWCDGALYFLPRDSFTQIPMMPEVLSNEWASETAVVPLAKLALAPEDFPFLHQIGGHDDGPALKLGEIIGAILAATKTAVAHEDRLTLTLNWSEALADDLAELEVIREAMMPVATLTLTHQPGQETAEFDMALPPAFRQVFQNSLQEKGLL